jgi:hypothetical protein
MKAIFQLAAFVAVTLTSQAFAVASDTVYVPPEDEPAQLRQRADSRAPVSEFRPWSGYRGSERIREFVPAPGGPSGLPPMGETVIVDPYAAPPVALPPEADRPQFGRQGFAPPEAFRPFSANRPAPGESFDGSPARGADGGRNFVPVPQYRRRPVYEDRPRYRESSPGRDQFSGEERSPYPGFPTDQWRPPSTGGRSEFRPAVPMPGVELPEATGPVWRGSWLINGQTGPVARRVLTGLPAPAQRIESPDDAGDPDDADSGR